MMAINSRRYHPGPNGKPAGYICPQCDSPRVYTGASRENYPGGIYRKPSCRVCRYQWGTIEVAIPSAPGRIGDWIPRLIAHLQRVLTGLPDDERATSRGGLDIDRVGSYLAQRKKQHLSYEEWQQEKVWARDQIAQCTGREPFWMLLALYRLRIGWSCKHLADVADLDPSYIVRLEHIARLPARPGFVLRLAAALRLSDYEQDTLLVAAGHAPVSLCRIGWTYEMHNLALFLREEGS